jgi:hypothetical protein
MVYVLGFGTWQPDKEEMLKYTFLGEPVKGAHK